MSIATLPKEVLFSAKKGKEKVKEIIECWTNKYRHVVKYLKTENHYLHQYVASFSVPSITHPVPNAIVHVYFYYDSQINKICYQFENSNLLHTVDFENIAGSNAASWIAKYLKDKMQIKNKFDVTNKVESTQRSSLLTDAFSPSKKVDESSENKPPRKEEDPSNVCNENNTAEDNTQEFSDNQIDPLFATSLDEGPFHEKNRDKIPFYEFLQSVFHAADESNSGFLSYSTVIQLVFALPIKLTNWDRINLMTSINDTGETVEYSHFLEKAPSIVTMLEELRSKYGNIQRESVITENIIELCFAEEIDFTVSAVREEVEKIDLNEDGSLTRSQLRSCLENRPECFTVQEKEILMHSILFNDAGRVTIANVRELLLEIRLESLNNSIIESTPELLRRHIISQIHEFGIFSDCTIPLFLCRKILLSCRQINISRCMCHCLLGILPSSMEGEVTISDLIRYSVSFIHQCFSSKVLNDLAMDIYLEKEQEQFSRTENAHHGVGGSGGVQANNNPNDPSTADVGAMPTSDDHQEELKDANVTLDREQIAKNLVTVCQVYADANHKGVLPFGAICQLLLSAANGAERYSDLIVSTRFTANELQAVVSACEPLNDKREVAYVDAFHTWVLLSVEMRKQPLYKKIMSMTKEERDAWILLDLSEWEAKEPFCVEPEEEEGFDNSLPADAEDYLSDGTSVATLENVDINN